MSVAVIDRNDVVLRGRLSEAAEFKELPSGDTLVTWRLVVRRPRPQPQPRSRGSSVDVLACVTFDRALQKRVGAWLAGDVVEVEGALQRRFWRTATGTTSVVEVNCRRGRKVPRASAGGSVRTA